MGIWNTKRSRPFAKFFLHGFNQVQEKKKVPRMVPVSFVDCMNLVAWHFLPKNFRTHRLGSFILVKGSEWRQEWCKNKHNTKHRRYSISKIWASSVAKWEPSSMNYRANLFMWREKRSLRTPGILKHHLLFATRWQVKCCVLSIFSIVVLVQLYSCMPTGNFYPTESRFWYSILVYDTAGYLWW